MGVHSCPDCNGMVSDRAAACPHCGSPVVMPAESTGLASSAPTDAVPVEAPKPVVEAAGFQGTFQPSETSRTGKKGGLAAMLLPGSVPACVSAILRLLYLSMIPLGVALLTFLLPSLANGSIGSTFEMFSIVVLLWSPLILAYHGALGALLGKGFGWARIVAIASAATIVTIVGIWSMVWSVQVAGYPDSLSWVFPDWKIVLLITFEATKILGFLGWALLHLLVALRLRRPDVRAFFNAVSSPI